jgi:hypothetical protein
MLKIEIKAFSIKSCRLENKFIDGSLEDWKGESAKTME